MLRQIFTLVALTTFALPCFAASTRQAEAVPCRMSNSSFNLDDEELPACKTHDATPAAARAKAPVAVQGRAPASVVRAVPVPVRAPASSAPAMSFEEYMAQNAGNPALSGKIPDHQAAFVEPVAIAVIANPEQTNTASPSAVAPAGGAVTAPSGAAGYTLPAGITLPPGMTLPPGVNLPAAAAPAGPPR